MKTETKILYVSIANQVDSGGVMIIGTEDLIPVTIKTKTKTLYAQKKLTGYAVIKLADLKQLIKDANK